MSISGQIADAGTGRLFESDRCDPPGRCAGPAEISDVFVPGGAVDPSSDMSVAVRVQNTSTGRPEHACDRGSCDASLCPDGLCTTVVVDPSWVDGVLVTDACVCGADRIVNVPVSSPGSDGTFSVAVWVEVGSESTDSIERSVTYRDGGSNACRVPTECAVGETCIGGRCQSTEHEPPVTAIFGLLLSILVVIDVSERFL